MSKVLARLLIFSIGLPAVLALVYFLPQGNHLAANLAAAAASAIGAAEFAFILSKRGYHLPSAEAAVFGAALPLASTMRVSFSFTGEWELYAIVALSLYLFSSRIFSRQEKLPSVAGRIVAGFSCMLYPGAFLMWVVRLNALPESSTLLLVYLLMIFGNDSVAWAVGMLFGKGNRGMIPASPNKSIAGFIGGIAVSIVLGSLAAVFLPAAFPTPALNRWFAGALLGFLAGTAGVIGDLAESAVKRSAEVKDSGSIIPGRGGILDSIDSIAFAAPVFFASYILLFPV